jgi:hypothetical protein
MKRNGSKNCHYFRFKVNLSETEAKSCHHFRFEAKQKQNLFRFDAKKVFFSLVFASEAKQK